MSVPCRCIGRVSRAGGGTRTCDTRKTLSKRPADYVRPPVCLACGSTKWMIDRYRRKVELPMQEKCWCEGYSFQHRKGSRLCVHHPSFETVMNETYGAHK